MEFNKLIDKYGMEATPPMFEHWEDRQPVVDLKDHLKESEKFGVYLGLLDNDLNLRFSPGLGHDDSFERWAYAEEAERLLFKASDDLYWLLNNGKINLRKLFNV